MVALLNQKCVCTQLSKIEAVLSKKICKSGINNWVSEKEISDDTDFLHTLIEQKTVVPDDLMKDLVLFFEDAHRDARDSFHKLASISLHPLGGESKRKISYPSSLPKNIHRGYFGETLAGFVSLYFKTIGDHDWVVPVYLHRNHHEVTDYLKKLRRNEINEDKQMIGRKGDDFIALCLNADGTIDKVLVVEAKYRSSLVKSSFNALLKTNTLNKKGAVKKFCVLEDLSKKHSVPNDLSVIGKILEETDYDKYKNTILDIEKIESDLIQIDRIDLVLVIYTEIGSRTTAPLLTDSKKPVQYTSGRDLQVTEMYVNGGESLIEEIFTRMYLEK